jgi:anti-sigma factor RsiW
VSPRVACADGVELLIEYLEGALAPATREALETHVLACPRCVAFIESYRATPRILRDATAAELPRGLAHSLQRFLASRR